MTAAKGEASSGLISGSGFDIANTIGSLAILFTSFWPIIFGAETPKKTSAPAITSLSAPDSFSGFEFSASQFLLGFRFVRLEWIAPLLSQTIRFFTPRCIIIFVQAIPAAPAPDTMTLIFSTFFPTTLSALIKAAVVTTAVPC